MQGGLKLLIEPRNTCRGGEYMNIKEIYERQVKRVYCIAMLYLKNKADAEDAVQNVFIKLMEKPIEFESLEHEKAWFIMVTKNYCKDVLKSSWFRKVELGELPELVQEDEEEQELLIHIYSLGKKYREVVYLYYYEEYSVKEISKILHRKESTIQTQLATARKKLRLKLEEEEILWTRN